MYVDLWIFYFFAAVLLASAVLVITARNPVHAVLFLILAFFNAAALFVLQGAEFLAMILVVVYVGAVAVLFLFVVMMLDVDLATVRAHLGRYAPIGSIVAGVLVVELLYALGITHFVGGGSAFEDQLVASGVSDTNTEIIGDALFTTYAYLFEIAGLVLLVAMIGAIVLTHRRREGVMRQVIAEQVARSAADEVKLVKVKTGDGIK
ncbi:MAG: NADH-quinone oxidoreductase subunit J [Pseudomonadota bacterium]